MKLIASIIDSLLSFVRARKDPFEIKRDGIVTMRRWCLIPRNKWFNIYHHEILNSDPGVPHDHPWASASLILHGELGESIRSQNGAVSWREYRYYQAGKIVFRGPKFAHSLRVLEPCRTLFFTGPIVREWGFWCPNGWVGWRDFTAYAETGDSSEAIGCGEH